MYNATHTSPTFVAVPLFVPIASVPRCPTAECFNVVPIVQHSNIRALEYGAVLIPGKIDHAPVPNTIDPHGAAVTKRMGIPLFGPRI